MREVTHNKYVGLGHTADPITACSLAVLLCVLGCEERDSWRADDPPDPNHIAQTDRIRHEYGLRPIQPDLRFYRRGFGAIDWTDGTGRYSKRVQYDSDYKHVLWEQDYYYSGHKFLARDPDAGYVSEFIAIMLDYRTEEIRLDVITADATKYDFPLGDPSKFDRSSKGEPSLERAHRILKMWGMKRL